MPTLHAFAPDVVGPSEVSSSNEHRVSIRRTDYQSRPYSILPPVQGPVPVETLSPILIADDDADDTFFIERLIKKTGVKNPVRTFDDGTEVVNFLGGSRLSTPAGRLRCPRLLFLDLKMRGLGGFEFLEWARQQKDPAPLTIVVLSNSNEPADVTRALELGAHRYLVKYPCVHTINTIVRSVYPQTVF